MNQTKLTKKLNNLGVITNYSPNGLEYVLSIDAEKTKISTDKDALLTQIISNIGRDAYKKNITCSSNVIVSIDKDYKNDFLKILTNYSSRESMLHILKTNDTYEDIMSNPILKFMVPTVVGSIMGVTASTTYIYFAALPTNDIVASSMLIGAIATDLIWGGAMLYNDNKILTNYHSRIGARRVYDSLIKNNLANLVDTK